MNKEIMLKVEKINKTFASTKALSEVSIDFYKGEIRGLIGENGSGKSTLSSIIAGVQNADTGLMTLYGQQYAPHNMLEAQQKGISMVVQEMGTISNITVAANIFLGREKMFTNFGFVDARKMNEKATEILKKVGASHIDSAAMIDSLSFEDRKLIEIARAMFSEPNILIVDETTTALSQNGREIIFNIMRKMKEENRSVIFISHDLEELESVCDSVSILRDGTFIKTLNEGEINIDVMKLLMIGREITGDYYRPDYDGIFSEDVLVSIDSVVGKTLKSFSIDVHSGEILGIGGLTDCGMHELGRMIFGIDKPDSGKVLVKLKDGSDMTEVTNPRKAIRNKISYVSKNRDQEAVILNYSIKDNIALPSLNIIKKGPFIFRKNENDLAQEQKDSLKIKCSSINQYCMYLSGGNKQKVVLGKWLGNKSEIFIFDCPTRGIDIGVKAAIYHLMVRLKKEGKAIIMISEEMPELIGMSDRLVILKNGVHSKTFQRSPELAEADVIKYMI